MLHLVLDLLPAVLDLLLLLLNYLAGGCSFVFKFPLYLSQLPLDQVHICARLRAHNLPRIETEATRLSIDLRGVYSESTVAHLVVQVVELLLCLFNLLLECLHLSLSLVSVEIILALSEELLLRGVEKLLIGQTELPLHLRDLPTELIIFALYMRKIFQSVKFSPCRFRLDREGVAFLHHYLAAHPLDSASESVGLWLFDEVEWKRVVHLVVMLVLLCQDYITFLKIGGVS